MLNIKYINIVFLVVFFASVYCFAGNSDNQINEKHIEAGLQCIDCHMTETPVRAASQKSCKACHEGVETGEKIILKDINNKEYLVNPHNAHTGALRCTICHHIHTSSELYCNKECHHSFTISVP